VAVARASDPRSLMLVDLGSRTVRALVAVATDTGLHPRAAASRPYTAGHDGVPVDRALARAQLHAVMHEAEQQAGMSVRRVIVGLGGTALGMVRSSGSLELQMPVALRAAHLERALEAAACIGLPPDREVLHVLPTHYRVDGARVSRPPLGMRAQRLVAECAVITASRLALDNLERITSDLDRELVDVAAEPLVTAGVLLGPDDRKRGALLLDVGADRIGAVLYRDHVLQALVCLGVGAGHITRDMAYALQLDFAAAEELKHRFAVASQAAVTPDLETTLESGGVRARLSQTALARVVEPRLRELLGMVAEELREARVLSPGDRVVLGGGGARMRGIVEVAEDVFGLPARLAEEASAAGTAAIGDASATVLGLLDYASRCGAHAASRGPTWHGAVQRLRQVFGAGGARRDVGACSPARAVFEAAAHEGGHVPQRVGVDLEVGDVRV